MSTERMHVQIPIPPDANYLKQSEEVPGTRRPGQTGHYRCTAYPEFNMQTPGMYLTALEIFDEGLKTSRDKPFLGHRPLISASPPKYADHYVWETYSAVDIRRRAIGSALQKFFQEGLLKAGDMKTVGIWARNRPEWELVDLALNAYGNVTVALYDTLGKEAVEYIAGHAELSIIFASVDHVPFLLKIASSLPLLKMIVSLDPLSDEARAILSEWSQAQNVRVLDLPELEEIGRANLIPVLPVAPSDIITICYTSGTTGPPKGVLLSHANIVSAAVAQLAFGIDIETTVGYSYLPLAHVYERVMILLCVALGARVGFTVGDPLKLMEDMQILKPTFVAAVPRVLNRIYQAAMVAATAPGVKGALFRRGVEVKLQRLRTTGQYKHAFWDRLIFSKIRAVMGGRVNMMACGSAPISAPVMDFMRIALCANLMEGEYGMTENCATISHVWPLDPTSSGTVGAVMPCNELKLIDVLEMGYSAEDKPHPRGEICVRGENQFKGYYKDPANTQATIDAEGWVHTGDVGSVDEVGRLKIIDRVKNIMKLSQGEYVALESIENVYSSCPLLAQLFVHGDSLQSYLIAVVVVDPALFAPLVSAVYAKTVDPTDTKTLAQAVEDPKVIDAVLKELMKVATKEGLRGFEVVKRIHVTLEPFTVDNGCLTPTFKVRRRETYAAYQSQLDALYALGEPTLAKL